MPSDTKLDRPVSDGGPTPDLVARVSAASRAFLDASGDQREAATLHHSASLIGEVLDACRTRAALDDLDRRTSAGFPVWIPDAALELGRAPCPCGSGRKHKRCCGRAGRLAALADPPTGPR